MAEKKHCNSFRNLYNRDTITSRTFSVVRAETDTFPNRRGLQSNRSRILLSPRSGFVSRGHSRQARPCQSPAPFCRGNSRRGPFPRVSLRFTTIMFPPTPPRLRAYRSLRESEPQRTEQIGRGRWTTGRSDGSPRGATDQHGQKSEPGVQVEKGKGGFTAKDLLDELGKHDDRKKLLKDAENAVGENR